MSTNTAAAGFTPVDIQPQHALRHAFHFHASEGILLIAFSGTYGLGSLGNTDADYMRAMCRAGIAYFQPAAVYDFTALHYEWGDMTTSVLNPDPNTPWVVITSDLCGGAIYSLLADDDVEEEGETAARHMADDLPSAMQLLAQQS